LKSLFRPVHRVHARRNHGSRVDCVAEVLKDCLGTREVFAWNDKPEGRATRFGLVQGN
jgi:hypothetical protein